MLDICLPGTRGKVFWTQQALRPHHMENENFATVVAIKDTTGWFHDLAITRAPEFRRPATTFGVICQLCDVAEDTLD